MNAQQAWQATLGQLQMELSRAAYDTWVKNTQLVSYDEQNATFTLGTANAYACDWLESRLKSTLINKLSGMMARPVEVCFKVWAEGAAHTLKQTSTGLAIMPLSLLISVDFRRLSSQSQA